MCFPRICHRAALLSLVLAAAPACADLMLHPTRLVFEKNQRTAQIELINNGSQSATYRISVVNRRMTDSGRFEAADTAAPGEQFADTMLRYAPRQITLQPGTAQTVRIMLHKPDGLADGEYRSHLLFDKLPDVDGTAGIARQGQDAQGIGVRLDALVGASVPVIVRQGTTSATVTLSGLALRRDGGRDMLLLRFERDGSASVYGDLSVEFTPDGGKTQSVAQIGGIAVYTPNRVRQAALPLLPPAGTTLSRGLLVVRFRERLDAGGRLLAQAELTVP
jgi:P pilus assembly chaperone PapD